MKNHRKGLRFSLKKVGCSPYRGGELPIEKEISTAFYSQCKDFVAVMLFIQQFFHLECLLLFQIKAQPSVDYKKAFNVVFLVF